MSEPLRAIKIGLMSLALAIGRLEGRLSGMSNTATGSGERLDDWRPRSATVTLLVEIKIGSDRARRGA